MDPYGFQYRSKAHLIAIADIILSSIQFGWSLLFLVAAFAISEITAEVNAAVKKKIEETEGRKVEISNAWIVWMWFMAIALFTICVIELVAAVKLLNATQPGKEPVKAFKWSKFWRAVNGTFLIIIILNLFFCSSDRGFFGVIFILIAIGIRGAALFFVQKFIKELEGYTQCGTLPGAMYQSEYPSQGGDMMDSKPPPYDYANQ